MCVPSMHMEAKGKSQQLVLSTHHMDPRVEFGTAASRQAPPPRAEPSHWPSVMCKEDPELPAPKSSTSG